jgi:uncharacterized protein
MKDKISCWMLAGLLTVLSPAALSAAPAATTRTIVMTGQGSVAVTPDQATVAGGVISQANAASDAVAANAETMSRVMAALKQMGIPDKDIHTTRFDLEPQYVSEDDKSGQPRRIAGYDATNGVSVRLDDVSHAGAVLDALIHAGANQSVNVDFEVKDQKPALAEARKKAAEDALERAQTYASALGSALGPVLTVGEGQETTIVTGSRIPQRGLYSNSPVTEVSPSEQTVDAEVTIVWELK